MNVDGIDHYLLLALVVLCGLATAVGSIYALVAVRDKLEAENG